MVSPKADEVASTALQFRNHEHDTHHHTAQHAHGVAQKGGSGTAGKNRQVNHQIGCRRVIVTITVRKNLPLSLKIWVYDTTERKKKQGQNGNRRKRKYSL